jgi:hypothetical protein
MHITNSVFTHVHMHMCTTTATATSFNTRPVVLHQPQAEDNSVEKTSGHKHVQSAPGEHCHGGSGDGAATTWEPTQVRQRNFFFVWLSCSTPFRFESPLSSSCKRSDQYIRADFQRHDPHPVYANTW